MTYSKEAQRFVDKIYPCIKPCDSYGVCDGCAEKLNFDCGYELATKSLDERIKKLEAVAKAARGLEKHSRELADDCGEYDEVCEKLEQALKDLEE